MRRNIAICVGLAILAGFTFSSHLTAPFPLSHQGWNGGYYGLAARNFLRYGYGDLGFMLCVEPGPVVEEPRFYLHHPPGVSLLSSGSARLLGESELALRLPHYALAVATVPLLFLWLVGSFRGRWMLAAGASITALAAPAWLFYAHQVEPFGSAMLFSIVGALFFADRWLDRRGWLDLLACFLFLLIGFATAWTVYFVAGLLALVCLIGKDAPGRSGSVRYLLFALLCGIATLLWIRHVGSSSGFDVPQLIAAALHRVGWLHRFTDDAGNPIRVGRFFASLAAAHLRMFLPAVSAVGAASSLLLFLRILRGHSSAREALWLVPLGVAVTLGIAFPQAVFQHEYLQLVLAVGFAIPPFALAFVWTQHRHRLDVDLSAVALSLVALVFGIHRSQQLWSNEDIRIAAERQAGELVHNRVAPDEILLADHPRTANPALVFYADRKNEIVPDAEALKTLLRNSKPSIGGLLVRDERAAIFLPEILELGWRGPVRVGGYSFWDARAE